jgi:glycosyltransferase involved in cell wall biosynthesis
MPSLLSDYPGAATGRDKKLVRALQSVLDQSFKDFELIVVADGCKLTEFIVKKIADTTKKVRLLFVKREQLFSNVPRNTGIENARGDYIIYIDNDDYWGKDHLKIINDKLDGQNWVYFEDLVWSGAKWVKRDVDVKQYGRCGTSNICHARRLDLLWKEAGYGHDFMFIQQLCEFPGEFIGQGEYHVGHFANGGSV